MVGKEMMNRAGQKLGKLTPWGTEDRRLKAFFGANVLVIIDAWSRMKGIRLIPEGGMLFHFLWALMFMKLYESENASCGHAGGVDAKTFQKWVWPFIFALAELEATVVSFTMLSI